MATYIFIIAQGDIVKNLGRLGSGGAGDSGLEKQSFPRALPDTLDRILGKGFTLILRSPPLGRTSVVDLHWFQSVLRIRMFLGLEPLVKRYVSGSGSFYL